MLTETDLKYCFQLFRFILQLKIFPLYFTPGTVELMIIDGARARLPMRILGLVELIYVLFMVTRCVYCTMMYPFDPLGTPLGVGLAITFSVFLLAAFVIMEVHLEIMVMLMNGCSDWHSRRWQVKGELGHY